MAVMQIERISIYAMKKDRKQILELLQRRNAIEVSDICVDDDVFEKPEVSASANLFKSNAKLTRDAVEVLDKRTGYKSGMLSFLRGRDAIDKEKSDDFYRVADVVFSKAHHILRMERKISEEKAQIARMEAAIAGLEPWLSLPFSLSVTSTKECAVFTGAISGDHDLPSLLGQVAQAAPELENVHIELICADKRQTCFYLICLKRDRKQAELALREMGFTQPPFTSRKLPADEKKQLEENILQAQKEIADAENEIKALDGMRDDFSLLEDHFEMRAEKYEALNKLCESRHVFVLEGYVLAGQSNALKQELENGFCCEVQLKTPDEHEDQPVALKNNSFSVPTESVLASYSLPGKGDIDPTNVMSIFYYVMFGLMFSDAGYGLILAAACGICLLKFKNMESNWRKNLTLFFWCGVSTVFWGIIFSSYFGDVVNVVSRTFFGQEVGIPPVWFAPLEQPMQLLVFCLGIGVIHLTTGYILKGVTCARSKDISGVIYDSVFPIAAMYPLILLLMGSDIFLSLAGFRLYLPEIVVHISSVIAGVSIVGVILTGGRESRSWGKRILKGLYAVYNVLAGWLSDILSYSRLLALGLATGVIASVMNQLGTMIGNNIPGIILFILVFAVGQALNFGINVLGAYVHSNRLEFVEFFGKFYEGGGREFRPLGIHTKHYKIVEEETQNG